MEHKNNNAAFIDSQNVNLAILDQGWKLDFCRFRRYLKDKYHIEKAFLFIGYLAENEPLYTHLQKCGYIVIFKPTLKRKDGNVKGNVDAELVLHAMIEYPQYNQAVIVTGDGDFYCLVDYLNRQGKLLRLMVPNVHKYSKLLKPFSRNKLDFMNNLQKKAGEKEKTLIKRVFSKEGQLRKDRTSRTSPHGDASIIFFFFVFVKFFHFRISHSSLFPYGRPRRDWMP